MAEEFHAGICEGTWWNNSSKTMPSACSSPPFSTGNSDLGSFGWATTNTVDTNLMSCDKESTIISVSDNSSIAFQGAHHQKPLQQPDSDCGTGSSILIDSTFKMMGYQSFLTRSNGRSDGYNSILQEDISSRLSCLQEPAVDSSQIQKRWSPKSYTSPGEDSSITTFKPVNQDFSLETSTGNNTTTCQGLSAEFPMGSASNYGLPSTLLQGLFEPDPQSQQQSLFTNRSINYMSTYGANVNELSNSWPPKLAPFIRPSLPKQHSSSLHFSNKTPFWNASATGINNVKAGFSPSPQPQFLAQTFEEKPNCPTITIKTNTKQVRNSASVMKKGSGEPPLKRTPSPLPTFKVRKEKLGDRITALQQLVSPFGKTDTASVLHEAIEYIKFLHDQVNVLSTPYMKQTVVSNSIQQQQQQSTDKLKQPEGPKQDLRSRGLCLVPISSTFPVANETTGDFWTPTFGGTFR